MYAIAAGATRVEVGDIECPILVNIAVLFGMPMLDFAIVSTSQRQQMDLRRVSPWHPKR